MAVTGTEVNILKMTAQADAVTGNFFVRYFRWVGATTAGHTCVVSNAAGVILWESVADGGYFIDVQPVFQWVKGITVTTKTSGNLFVYLG